MNKISFHRLIWISALASMSILSELALGGSVTRVNRDRGIFEVDAGESAGFSQGARVCVYRGETRATCGVVMRASNNRASVRVRTNIERVRRGMSVRLQEERASSSQANIKHRRNIKLSYLLTIMSPSEFNKVVYQAPEESGEVDTLWNQTETAGLSLLGFNSEFEMPVGASISLAAGFRYRAFRGLLAEADYDKITPNQDLYVLVEQNASALGFYFDTYFLDINFTNAFMMRLSGGLDIDMSTVELNAQRKVEQGSHEEFPVANVTSKATVISLRLGTHFNFFLDPLGIHTSLNILVPLTAMGQSVSGSSEDPNSNLLSGERDMIDDIQEQLAHGTGSVGLELLFGVSFAF